MHVIKDVSSVAFKEVMEAIQARVLAHGGIVFPKYQLVVMSKNEYNKLINKNK